MENQEREELSEYQKLILSQMVNSDAKTIEELGLMYQKQLAEIYQQQNFLLGSLKEQNNEANS